jgi:hypothetical protein
MSGFLRERCFSIASTMTSLGNVVQWGLDSGRVMLDMRRVVLLSTSWWLRQKVTQGQYKDHGPENGFADDGGRDFCSVCMRCIPRVCWTVESVLDDACWWKVGAYGSDHCHPFIKVVGVAILFR